MVYPRLDATMTATATASTICLLYSDNQGPPTLDTLQGGT